MRMVKSHSYVKQKGNSQNKMCVWTDSSHKAGDFVKVKVLDCTQATLLCELAE